MDFIRKPAVAGYFYPSDKERLKENVATLFRGSHSSKLPKINGLMIPHAGYEYSGSVAAQTVSGCALKDRLIILGPNHTGLGESFSVMAQGQWQTPLGSIRIDSILANEIIKESQYCKADVMAHHSEHSIEVLLPILLHNNKNIEIVPIVVSHAKGDILRAVAADICRALKKLNLSEEVSIIASSDMTHFESQNAAKDKDQYAIDSILKLDADELLSRVKERNISMCGVFAVFIMLEIVKELGAHKTELIKYQTSGDATKDYSSVVGYAGIRIQ